MENLQTQGIALPKLGLGTFRMQGDACRAAVESGLELGYRHLDTAEMYGNEEAIGAALAASRVARKDLHVTTKVWHENLAPDAIRRAFDASCKKLRLDHVDLYLVHWPSRNMNLPAIFETLMKLKQEGRTRAIGVANFSLRNRYRWSPIHRWPRALPLPTRRSPRSGASTMPARRKWR